MTNNERLQKEKIKQAQTNRMMLVFFLLIVVDFALFYLKNAVDNVPANSFISLEFPFYVKHLLPIPAILFVACLINRFTCKKDSTLSFFTPSLLLGLSSSLLIIVLLLSFLWNKGFLLSIIYVTVVCTLYFIFVIFSKSFFFFACFNAIAAFSLYLVRALASPHNQIVGTLLILFAITFNIFLLFLKKNGGRLGKFELLAKDSDYSPLLISSILYLALIIATIFYKQYILYYILLLALETLVYCIFYAIKMLK